MTDAANKTADFPRSRAPRGTSKGRVLLPLSASEKSALETIAAREGRSVGAMARVLFLAGIKAVGADLANQRRRATDLPLSLVCSGAAPATGSVSPAVSTPTGAFLPLAGQAAG